MPEPRSCQVMMNLEPMIYDVFTEHCSKLSVSLSSYLRALLIEDLIDKGLLPPEKIKEILVGIR